MTSHLPREIRLTVMWNEMNTSMSAYSMYQEEIIHICRQFEIEQLNLFTFVGEEVICEWIAGTFLRKPVAVHIDKIIY
tara:strand:+ start:144 stop:377 length:234 start_codon:yes stop_codon:yes gene_type:complete